MIQNLDLNKAHGHDQISIRMLKNPIIWERTHPQTSIKSNLQRLRDWKRGNVVPVFKKGDKQILKNYRPIWLLSVCGKIFEKLIFNEMFKFFIENDLISPNQSGFKPGDSCINQLLSITFVYKYIYIFTNLLTTVMKVDVFFLIFRKRLTKFGMMISYSNWNKVTYLENYTNFYMTS